MFKTTISVSLMENVVHKLRTAFGTGEQNPMTKKRWRSISEVTEYYVAKGLGMLDVLDNDRHTLSRRRALVASGVAPINYLEIDAESMNLKYRNDMYKVQRLFVSLFNIGADLTSVEGFKRAIADDARRFEKIGLGGGLAHPNSEIYIHRPVSEVFNTILQPFAVISQRPDCKHLNFNMSVYDFFCAYIEIAAKERERKDAIPTSTYKK